MSKKKTPFTSDWLKSVLAANPHLSADHHTLQDKLMTTLPRVEPIPEEKKTKGALKGRRKINKTEAAYGRLLEARKSRGEIIDYQWEGITLRWEDGMTYSPDFVVYESVIPTEGRPFVSVLFVEVKGGHIFDDSKVKFRAAREKWPMFRFEMQQCKKGEWQRIA